MEDQPTRVSRERGSKLLTMALAVSAICGAAGLPFSLGLGRPKEKQRARSKP